MDRQDNASRTDLAFGKSSSCSWNADPTDDFKEFPARPSDRKAAVRRYACTSKNDGHCYFCTLFSRSFSCQQLRRIRRPRRSVALSREQRFFNTTVPLVMELMGEGMDRPPFP
jgi:hypothetical protein